MNRKAIIFDLDNTIYPVPSIGDRLFASLYQLIRASGQHNDNFDTIRADIQRKPFQLVASTHGFSDELTRQGIELLKETTYTGEIEPFSDYYETRHIPVDRFLVTTGFKKLQYSKIRGMNIEPDFKEIHIVDPLESEQTKKEVFADIIQRYCYATFEVLVVGDDLESEIKAAQALGIDTVLYDRYNMYPFNLSTYKITDFTGLTRIINDVSF